jgi:tetratricopeptide (TPR) repeat protein
MSLVSCGERSPVVVHSVQIDPADRAEVHMFSGMKDLIADELRTEGTDDHLADLLDSAQLYLKAREPDRAIAVWKQLIEAGGEESDWGHLEYADYLLRRGKEQEAHEHLVALMVGRRVCGEPWRLTAELLEERGDPDTALFWYSAAASQISPEPSASGEPLWARQMRAGRRRLKWAIGIPFDDDDLRAELGVREADDKWFDLLRLMGDPEVVEGRLAFWARGDFVHAQRLWSVHIVAPTAETYYAKIEAVLRTHGGGPVVLVPRSVRAWMAGVEATNNVRSMAELRPFASRLDDGQTVEWPPGRNDPCWCGSASKYTKCCGESRMLVGSRPG